MVMVGKFHECLIHCNYFYRNKKHFLQLYYSLSASSDQLQTELLCCVYSSCAKTIKKEWIDR